MQRGHVAADRCAHLLLPTNEGCRRPSWSLVLRSPSLWCSCLVVRHLLNGRSGASRASRASRALALPRSLEFEKVNTARLRCIQSGLMAVVATATPRGRGPKRCAAALPAAVGSVGFRGNVADVERLLTDAPFASVRPSGTPALPLRFCASSVSLEPSAE